ncbi:MAG: hypothetical protein LKE89_07185 [Lactobacillaceae bacterium]|jgi:hypothetical protein|nr:hypothetical protein [Lactobacillaceae bacterium]
MKTDINEEERAQLKAAAYRKEQQLEEFQQVKNGYLQLLENFNTTFNDLARDYEETVNDDLAHEAANEDELAANQELKQQTNRTIADQYDATNQLYNRIRRQSDGEIDDLNKQRSRLPWA